MLSFVKQSLSAFRSGNTVSIFITDSVQCPCNYFLRLSEAISSGKQLHITSIDSPDTDRVNKAHYQQKNLIVYVHGDNYQLTCFYKSLERRQEKHVYIPDEWWNKMARKNGKLYFHACYGANILNGNASFRNNFKSWVSYTNPVWTVVTGINNPVSAINRRFIENVNMIMKKKETAGEIKTGIENAYIELIKEMKKMNPDQVKGHTALMTCFYENILNLKSS